VKFVCISIYCVSALSLHIESTDSMIIRTRSITCLRYPYIIIIIIRERGSVLYLGMATEILNLP